MVRQLGVLCAFGELVVVRWVFMAASIFLRVVELLEAEWGRGFICLVGVVLL